MTAESRCQIFLFLICVSTAVVPLAGCGSDMTPTGPEPGSVQAYLDAHPEAMEDPEEEPDGGDEG